MKVKFRDVICVRCDDGEMFIIGTPDGLDAKAADDGDLVAVYRLERIMTFSAKASLEPLGTSRIERDPQ